MIRIISSLVYYSNFQLRAGLRVGHFFVRVPALRIFLRGLNLLAGGGVFQSLKIDKKIKGSENLSIPCCRSKIIERIIMRGVNIFSLVCKG